MEDQVLEPAVAFTSAAEEQANKIEPPFPYSNFSRGKDVPHRIEEFPLQPTTYY